jgi:hypothetical protein
MPPDAPYPPRIDIAFLLNNSRVSFTQSSRRHRIGRLLEVIAVIEENQAVVIHAMDARPSVIRRYVEGTRRGTT